MEQMAVVLNRMALWQQAQNELTAAASEIFNKGNNAKRQERLNSAYENLSFVISQPKDYTETISKEPCEVNKNLVLGAIEKVIASYQEDIDGGDDGFDLIDSWKSDQNDYIKLRTLVMEDKIVEAYSKWRGMDTLPRDTLFDLSWQTAEEFAHCAVYFQTCLSVNEWADPTGVNAAAVRIIKNLNLYIDETTIV